MIWLSRPGGAVPNQFDLMRQWLDTGAKPAELRDACFMAGGVQADLTCNGTWTSLPRAAARRGRSPFTLDVVKCRLKPLARADYGVTFTDAQWAKLQAAFPTGVCDYAQPGVSQQPPKARWLTFADGPGGRRARPGARRVGVRRRARSAAPCRRRCRSRSARRRRSARSRPASRDDVHAATTANVISTAGDAALTRVRARPPGQRRVHAAAAAAGGDLAERLDRRRSRTTPVAITFTQAIGANDALRTGVYSRTLTFTLSTTNP